MFYLLSGHDNTPVFDLNIDLSPNLKTRLDQPISLKMNLPNRCLFLVTTSKLSPDIYVQSPYSSQSYNRYSYVFNNPLSYTDPSGFTCTNPSVGTVCESITVTGTGPSGSGLDFSNIQFDFGAYNQSVNLGLEFISTGSLVNLVTGNDILINADIARDLADGDEESAEEKEINEFERIKTTATALISKGANLRVEARRALATKKVVKCFVPGTLVLMADGTTKPIEDIEPGERVIGDNPEDEEPPKAYQVLARLESKTERIVRISIDDGDGFVDGDIESTGQHPYWTVNGGWKYAEDLQVGDMLLDSKSELIYVTEIDIEKRNTPTYNLSIDDVQTYFVVTGGKSVLVHNVDPFRFSSETNRWHGPNGQFTQSPSSDQMRSWARSQGWTNTHTTGAGFEAWSDANGQRVDGFNRPVVKKSVTARAPLKACL